MTSTTSSMSNVVGDQLSGFTQFVKEQNIVGLALGIILAQSSIELSKKLGSNLVKPSVTFLTGKDKELNINAEEIFTDMTVLIITLLVIYLLVTFLDIKPTRQDMAIPLSV